MHLIKRKLTSQLVYDKLTVFFYHDFLLLHYWLYWIKYQLSFKLFSLSRPKWYLFIYNHHKHGSEVKLWMNRAQLLWWCRTNIFVDNCENFTLDCWKTINILEFRYSEVANDFFIPFWLKMTHSAFVTNHASGSKQISNFKNIGTYMKHSDTHITVEIPASHKLLFGDAASSEKDWE